ncbi:Alternative oxidase [Diplonema papillatum]|nr:Alternative oxidase [Diplonema papillatum]
MWRTTQAATRLARVARQSRFNSQKADEPNLSPKEGEQHGNVHFRLTPNAHPLGKAKKEWNNPTQNHVWEAEELEQKLTMEAAKPVHKQPKGIMDRIVWWAVRTCYHGFNFITGYNKADPTTKSIVYRLLILESIAGCPGMVAAGVRHFRSLRRMKRDGGWIHTLLEEAENERMHLLVFMNMFTPGMITRGVVIAMQYLLVAILLSIYVVRPQIVHRFVGYLEETAVTTYLSVLKQLEDPNSQVHKEWSELPAPEIAITYWRLDKDAKFIDVVKQIAADEMHHRDVNHEFADMQQTDFNPNVHSHISDADKAATTRISRDSKTYGPTD